VALKPPEPYTDEERAVLEQVARDFGVPSEAVLEMIRLELAFHSMGRRRGLFPALRSVVRRLATDAHPAGGDG